MIPTEDGVKLITVLPDVVKSPKLTADWENELTQVSKGEVSAGQFMAEIKAMVSDLVKPITVSVTSRKICLVQEIRRKYLERVRSVAAMW